MNYTGIIRDRWGNYLTGWPPDGRLARWRAGTLGPDEQSDLQAHLDRCPDCRRRIGRPDDAPTDVSRRPGPTRVHSAAPAVIDLRFPSVSGYEIERELGRGG